MIKYYLNHRNNLNYFALALLVTLSITARTQEQKDTNIDTHTSGIKTPFQAPEKVDVTPLAQDKEIKKRLQKVLVATKWFLNPGVWVNEGIVFLQGEAESAEVRKWASELAHNTQDVVAVVNQMTVRQPLLWDFSPAWQGVLVLWHDFAISLPFIAFGLITFAISVGLGILMTRGSRKLLARKVRSKLLRDFIARAIGIFVILIGMYLILRISGLTQLALTVLGGTGLIGLILGIAFRDITENFLSSIFLSIQQPFKTGDLIEVTSVTGYVQQLNMRTTVLMALNGAIVQIPNAVVYKSNLKNFTTNINRREDFVVGIGYDDSIIEAQEIARKVLAEHPAILRDPEPWVLADNLGTTTINLRIYFWLNGTEYSWLKVRSSVIRLVKRAFQEHGISMPDAAREIIFPDGVPVTITEQTAVETPAPTQHKPSLKASSPKSSEEISTKAEVGLSSEDQVIQEQARKIPMESSKNLLRNDRSQAAKDKKKDS